MLASPVRSHKPIRERTSPAFRRYKLAQFLAWLGQQGKPSRSGPGGVDLVTSHVVRQVIERGLDSIERELCRK